MKPTIANPVRFLDHCIVWDEAERAFVVFVVGDSPANFLFHATTIDACCEAIAEVVGEAVCLVHNVELDADGDCSACPDEPEACAHEVCAQYRADMEGTANECIHGHEAPGDEPCECGAVAVRFDANSGAYVCAGHPACVSHDCKIDGCAPSSDGPDDGLACDAGHTKTTPGCEACGPGPGVTCKACGFSGNPEAVSYVGACVVCPRCTCYDPELVELVAAVL